MDFWVPAAVACLGLLVAWGGIRDLHRYLRKRSTWQSVAGHVVEIVEVRPRGEIRPFVTPVVEYVVDGETRRFQDDSVVSRGVDAPAVGDPATVLLPPGGGAPEMDRPGFAFLSGILTIALGLGIGLAALVVRMILQEPSP